MATLENGQTCLEKQGMGARQEQTVRSDYNKTNEYSAIHPDALSDGDSKGRGSGSGGHSAWLPKCDGTVSNGINYSNFDTNPEDQIGNSYDINGRNDIPGREGQMARSLYNYRQPYGANVVNTSQNVNDGQYYVGQQIGQPKQ